MDGNEIGVWKGSLSSEVVTSVICVLDLNKKDSEIKIVVDSTDEETNQILATHNRGFQPAILVK